MTKSLKRKSSKSTSTGNPSRPVNVDHVNEGKNEEQENDEGNEETVTSTSNKKQKKSTPALAKSSSTASTIPDNIQPDTRHTNTTMPSTFAFTAEEEKEEVVGEIAKICSWNVAGLQASLKKGFHTYVKAENPDILCLQETKVTSDPDLLRLEYPYQFWSSLPKGETKKSKYYGGVAMLSKVKPISWRADLGTDEDGEGRAIIAEFSSFHLIHTYVPNASQGLVRLKNKQNYNSALEKLMHRLDASDKPVIWTGDLNVAHEEIDLANPKTNHKNAGFTPEERADFTRILRGPPQFIDLWRHFNPRVQDYSYFSYRFNCRQKYIGWRLDYFVASQRLLANVHKVVMRTEAYGAADHVPLVLMLKNMKL